eukprot:c27684_g1_i1.p2 GENE.c27684_g1_i1~~c27684_g1_i1.p2  ORF type:complete len:389 (-),score=57.09 c27684_g1_i1:15-1130(-)
MGQDTGFRVGTIILILSLYYTLHHVVFQEWMFRTPTGIALVLYFNFLCVMIGVSYYYAHTTDPGVTPPGWRPNHIRDNPRVDVALISSGVELSASELHNMAAAACSVTSRSRKAPEQAAAPTTPTTPTIDIDKAPKNYCSACQEFKPPRSHHCRDCYRCVLKMDHHCPWVDNCVGHRNHKFFLQFLFYVVCGVGTALMLLLYNALEVYGLFGGNRRRGGFTLQGVIVLSLDAVMLLVVEIAVGTLAWDQVSMLGDGITTIEWYEYKATRSKCKRDGTQIVYQHDMGSRWRNLLAITGRRWRDLFFPTTAPGDGLAYLVRHDATPVVPPQPKGLASPFVRPSAAAARPAAATGLVNAFGEPISSQPAAARRS